MSELSDFCLNCEDGQLKDTAAIFPELGLHCGFTQGRVASVRRHGDKEGFVVSWMIQGGLAFESPEGNFRLCEPCVCLRRPGHQFSITFFREPAHRRYYLRISEEAYRMLLRFHPSLDTIVPIRKLPYDQRLSTRFHALIYRLLRASKIQVADLIPEMIALIVELSGIEVAEEETPLEKARRLLEQISGPRELSDIALACGMSYSSFRKRFTEAYGVSPGQYRIQCRVREAKRALREGDSIQAVADRLFYPDLYTFSHQFKRVTGVSPGEYRRQHAKAWED